jgi:hypothetical protein
MAGVRMDPDWLDLVLAASDAFFAGTLGPQIRDDAKGFCPVDTGALQDSIEDHLNGHTLIVAATGGAGGRTYAAWVELGHRVFHPSTRIVGPERVAPEPFLRPALWQVRSG